MFWFIHSRLIIKVDYNMLLKLPVSVEPNYNPLFFIAIGR